MEKSLVKDFSKYVSLNILGMIGVSFYILADTYYIAKALGATGIAALNFAIPVFSIILGIGLMIGIGGAARFGILKSRNKHKEAEAVFAGRLSLALWQACCSLCSDCSVRRHYHRFWVPMQSHCL